MPRAADPSPVVWFEPKGVVPASWSAQVMWSRAAGEHLIDTFSADDVRPLALT